MFLLKKNFKNKAKNKEVKQPSVQKSPHHVFSEKKLIKEKTKKLNFYFEDFLIMFLLQIF